MADPHHQERRGFESCPRDLSTAGLPDGASERETESSTGTLKHLERILQEKMQPVVQTYTRPRRKSILVLHRRPGSSVFVPVAPSLFHSSPGTGRLRLPDLSYPSLGPHLSVTRPYAPCPRLCPEPELCCSVAMELKSTTVAEHHGCVQRDEHPTYNPVLSPWRGSGQMRPSPLFVRPWPWPSSWCLLLRAPILARAHSTIPSP